MPRFPHPERAATITLKSGNGRAWGGNNEDGQSAAWPRHARDRSGVGRSLAQSPAEFYRGKTVDLQIGYSVGGGYDHYARLIARHLGKHIPGNPKVVPHNMPGAGGMRAANWLQGAAPKDGTVIGATSRAMAFEPLLGNKAAQIRSDQDHLYRQRQRRGQRLHGVAHLRHRDVQADVQERELVVGAGGTADDTYQFPAILNNMFGAKFKMVIGLCRRHRDQHRDGARRGARAAAASRGRP